MYFYFVIKCLWGLSRPTKHYAKRLKIDINKLIDSLRLLHNRVALGLYENGQELDHVFTTIYCEIG